MAEEGFFLLSIESHFGQNGTKCKCFKVSREPESPWSLQLLGESDFFIRLTANAVREIDAPLLSSALVLWKIPSNTTPSESENSAPRNKRFRMKIYQTFPALNDCSYHMSRKKLYSAIVTQTQYLHSKANWTETSVLSAFIIVVFCCFLH